MFKILIISMAFSLGVIMLTSCSLSSNRAPVHERLTHPLKKIEYHIVSKGETLYSIAWRYGIDYKLLAKRNGISPGYMIHPSQKIYLYKTVAAGNRTTVKKSTEKPPVTVIKPTAKIPATRSKTSTSSAPPERTKIYPKGDLKWKWPSSGEVIATFSSQNTLNKGIDIEGRLGEPVVAAAPGVVVYAGDGLRGYGNLLILKHNETFLSAYAHNSKVLVSENQFVKAGEKIAEIGSSGTDRTKLHFEIRKDGKPIDPRVHLPRR